MRKSIIITDKIKVKILAKELCKESILVKDESMSVLAEFERLSYDD